MHDKRAPKKIEIKSDQMETDYSADSAPDDYDSHIEPLQVPVISPDLGWDD